MTPQKLSALGIGGLVALIVLAGSSYILPQTEQALVLSFGKPIRVVQEPGWQWKWPFIQNVEFYDKRLLDFNAEPKEVIAADQKRLIVDAFVRYRITDPLRFKQTVGDERAMRARLNAILESSLRQAIGAVKLADVISGKRTATMQHIRNLVNAQSQGAQLDAEGKLLPPDGTRGFGIEVVDVRIVRADLPEQNSNNIYLRMQTEFEQQAKLFRAEGAEEAQKIRAEAEKERTILLAEARKNAEEIRAKGDAQALKIFANAAGSDAEFYGFYRSLIAYRKTLSASDTTLVLSPDGEFLRHLESGK